MTTFALLGSGLNTTTNPDPTTLTTQSPLTTGSVQYTGNNVNPLWTSQAKKCLIFPPQGLVTRTVKRCYIRFKPSSSSATYTVILWRLGFTGGATPGEVGTTPLWDKAFVGSSNDYTGIIEDYIENFDGTILYPQISAISLGTLLIEYDNQVAGII